MFTKIARAERQPPREKRIAEGGSAANSASIDERGEERCRRTNGHSPFAAPVKPLQALGRRLVQNRSGGIEELRRCGAVSGNANHSEFPVAGKRADEMKYNAVLGHSVKM